MPTPGYSWVPFLEQKQLHRLILTGTLNAQLPGVPDMMDHWLHSWPHGSILGNVVSHRMEAMRCLTAWCPILGLMPSQYSPWLGPSSHSTCSPCVLGTQAQSKLALPFQTMTRYGGYSRAMGQGHLTAGSGIWNTCPCGAIWT